MIEHIQHNEKIGFLQFMQAIGDVALYGLGEAAANLFAAVDDNLFDFGGED